MSNTIASTTEPIRNTAAYKTFAETIVDALDDSGSAKHAGFEEKEARRKRRQLRLAKAGRDGGLSPGSQRVAANPKYVHIFVVLPQYQYISSSPVRVQLSCSTKITQNKKHGTE